jgi:hypothetical protein
LKFSISEFQFEFLPDFCIFHILHCLPYFIQLQGTLHPVGKAYSLLFLKHASLFLKSHQRRKLRILFMCQRVWRANRAPRSTLGWKCKEIGILSARLNVFRTQPKLTTSWKSGNFRNCMIPRTWIRALGFVQKQHPSKEVEAPATSSELYFYSGLQVMKHTPYQRRQDHLPPCPTLSMLPTSYTSHQDHSIASPLHYPCHDCLLTRHSDKVLIGFLVVAELRCNFQDLIGSIAQQLDFCLMCSRHYISP